MATIQEELAKAGLIKRKKADLWEDINALKPEYRRVLKEKAEADAKDHAALERIDFRLQSVLKQIRRLAKAAKAI